MSQIKRKSFILYLDFAESFQYLSMEERGLLLTIIYDYVSGQPIPNDLPNMVKMAFSFIRKTLDRDGAAYEERCRIAIENGKKGGRPRKETIRREKTEQVFQKPDNDNVNDNDNDNDNDNVNVIDIGNGIGNDFANEDWEITPSAQAPISDSVPVIGSATSSAPCSADIQAEEEDLFALGVPRAYVEERRERAHAYARLHGGRVSDILLGWWREDQGKKKSYRRSAPISENKSYDLEEFFQAAVARSYESLAGT